MAWITGKMQKHKNRNVKIHNSGKEYIVSEFDKLNIQVSIPCEIYTKFGGRANLIYFLEHGEKELTELKEQLEKVTKIAEDVCGFYGDMYNDDPDDYHNNEFALQKQKELKEILK